MSSFVRASIDGYFADAPYPSTFQREFTPSWIDAVLRQRGLEPPRRPRGPFRLLDLGCGDGFGLVILAAAHPEGEFVGIDALPQHAASGEALAGRLGLGNIEFRCARFAELAAPATPAFDYVTAQGVLAWVAEANRRQVYRIAAEQLRDGGIACFGYNTMPGWRDLLAFQRLLRLLADRGEDSSFDRFAAALEQIRRLSAAGASTLSPALLEWIDAKIEQLPRGYFGHEYLNEHWQPLWSSEVMAAMAASGFPYLAPSRIDRLREDFCMKRDQRSALAGIDDPLARETAADIFTGCSFRVDLYGRGVAEAAEPRAARLDGWWAAQKDEADADYSCQTPAGTLRYDNAAAHAILRALEHGPATLRTIQGSGEGGTEADVLNAADALFVAGYITPADPPVPAPAAPAINSELVAAIRSGVSLDCQVGPHGAMTIPRLAVKLRHDDAAAASDRDKALRAFARQAIA